MFLCAPVQICVFCWTPVQTQDQEVTSTIMSHENPYKSPATLPPDDITADDVSSAPPDKKSISTQGTVLPRHIAAILDNMMALLLAVIVAKSFREDWPVVQTITAALTFLGYFFLSEGFLGRTTGKVLTGLMVVGLDGQRCTWRQALIRTVFRLLEVNAVLLGAAPAALSIVLSKKHQRFGDKVAGTVVVPTRRIRKFEKSA